MNVITTGIYNALSNSTTLTAMLKNGANSIYYMQAPEGAALDYVVYSLQTGTDMNICPSRLKDYYYNIRGYSRISAKKAGSIDAAIDAVMYHGSLSISGWQHIITSRQSEIEYYEVAPSGEIIYSAGGIYRVLLDS